MSRDMTDSEAIANLNHIYGFLSPNIQRSLDVAFKALKEKPTGEWEENENGTGFCSNCYEGIYYRTPTGRVYMMLKEQIVKFGYKYCPNCGADMRKPNCVRCDHFGDCDGCEKGEEE